MERKTAAESPAALQTAGTAKHIYEFNAFLLSINLVLTKKYNKCMSKYRIQTAINASLLVTLHPFAKIT